MNEKTYFGINVQHPISELIMNGEKTIETRTYPIPEKYFNIDIVLIETPGKKGKFKARAVAIIKFTKCFQYKTKKAFYADTDKHCVTKDSIWAWKDGDKWGWEVEIIKRLTSPVIVKQRGIVYRSNIKI